MDRKKVFAALSGTALITTIGIINHQQNFRAEDRQHALATYQAEVHSIETRFA